MIGLCDAGIITAGAGTLVGLGDITSPTFIVGIISILVTVALACRNVPGSLLIGIVVAVIAGIPLGVTQLRPVSSPRSTSRASVAPSPTPAACPPSSRSLPTRAPRHLVLAAHE